MNNLEYIRSGDYFIPNLTLIEQPQTPLGKYGRMRKTYLQEHHSALYSHLLLSEKLYAHLLKIDQSQMLVIDGWRMSFGVLCSDVLVEVRSKGLAPETIFDLLTKVAPK